MSRRFYPQVPGQVEPRRHAFQSRADADAGLCFAWFTNRDRLTFLFDRASLDARDLEGWDRAAPAGYSTRIVYELRYVAHPRPGAWGGGALPEPAASEHPFLLVAEPGKGERWSELRSYASERGAIQAAKVLASRVGRAIAVVKVVMVDDWH